MTDEEAREHLRTLRGRLRAGCLPTLVLILALLASPWPWTAAIVLLISLGFTLRVANAAQNLRPGVRGLPTLTRRVTFEGRLTTLEVSRRHRFLVPMDLLVGLTARAILKPEGSLPFLAAFRRRDLGFLRARLVSPDAYDRWRAARISRALAADLAPELRVLVRDDDATVAREASHALARVGTPEDRQRLMVSDDDLVWLVGASAATERGEPVRDPWRAERAGNVAATLDSSDRKETVRLLAGLGPPRAAIVREALGEAGAGRGLLAVRLARARDAEATELLGEALDSPDGDLVRSTLLFLRDEHPALRARVETLTEDPRPGVATAARGASTRMALNRMGEP